MRIKVLFYLWARYFQQVEQFVKGVDEQAIYIFYAEAVGAVEQDRRNVGGPRPQHIVDIGVADVQRVVANGIGALQGQFIERR